MSGGNGDDYHGDDDNNQTCRMSNFLHGWKFEFKILPQKRVNHDLFVFTTKRVNPCILCAHNSIQMVKYLFQLLTGENSQMKKGTEAICGNMCSSTAAMKAESHCWFGLNIQVPRIKLPQWKFYQTSVLMFLSKILPQTWFFYTDIYLPYLWIL